MKNRIVFATILLLYYFYNAFSLFGQNVKLEVQGQILASEGIKFSDGTVQNSASESIWHIVDNNGQDVAADITTALSTYKHVSLLPNKVYSLSGSSRIVIGENNPVAVPQTLYVPASTVILFNRKTEGSFAAVEMREKGSLVGDGKIKLQTNDSYYWHWGDDSKAAIMITGPQVKIDFGTVEGFEYGLTMGGNFGIQGCNIRFRNQLNCVIGVYMAPAGDGWTNQNYIHIDHMQSWSNIANNQPTIWNNSVGIYLNGDGDNVPNLNTLSGHIEGTTIGLRLEGAYNRIEGLRMEGCKTRIYIQGAYTKYNYLYGTYGEIVGLQTAYGDEMPIRNYTGKALHEVLTIYGWQDWTYMNIAYQRGSLISSDKRYKENIKEVDDALNKILSLRGTSYQFKSAKNEEASKQYGFIAQELKAVLPELVVTNPFDSMYAVNYDGVIPVLVEAFKEQQEMIEEQNESIEELKKFNAELITILKENQLFDEELVESTEKPLLYNNQPNPLKHKTLINYYIPFSISKSYITISDLNGKILMKENIEIKGESSVEIDNLIFEPGIYLYSLVCDGVLVSTKRMVIIE